MPPHPQQHPLFSALPNLRWEELDGEHIVFNPLSDEIHKLNPMAAAALSELETGNLNLATLANRMAGLMETPISRELLLSLQQLLLNLDEIGLIRILSSAPDRPSVCPPKPPE